jgi:hypothetical protein
VGVVIENALMFEDVSRRYDELSEVQYINRALLSSMEYGEVLQQIAHISAAMLRANGTLLFIADGNPPEARLEMQYTADGPPLPDAAVRRCIEIARETLERHAGILVRDVAARGVGRRSLDGGEPARSARCRSTTKPSVRSSSTARPAPDPSAPSASTATASASCPSSPTRRPSRCSPDAACRPSRRTSGTSSS